MFLNKEGKINCLSVGYFNLVINLFLKENS